MDVSSLVADRYRIDARIGGGGMADVFEAHDEALNRDVAIKLLRGIDDPAAARRFAEEIRLTARLNHPNVVRLFDAGEHDGSPFLVLERVTGGTLSHHMAAGQIAPERVAEIGRQTAAALEHAHGEGIVHRDVKPSNILLTADGTVRLADFGIALTATATRLTVAGSVAGSAGYVSPEQVLGTGAGAASDVYALGLVLLECLTGQPPWSGTTVEVALARITADPPIADTVPPAWRDLLRAMTARHPQDRPAMGVVAAALGDLAAGRRTQAFEVPTPAVAPPRKLRLSAAAFSTLLLLVAGGLATLFPPSPDPSPTSAGGEVTAAEPDGVIAASVVRGAAVGETTPSAAPETPAEHDRSSGPSRPAEDEAQADAEDSDDTIPSAPVDLPIRAPEPGITAPKPAPKPADATRDVQDRTRAPRETVDDTRESTDDAPAGDTDNDGDVDSDDATGSGEDTAPAPKGSEKGKAKAAKARDPELAPGLSTKRALTD